MVCQSRDSDVKKGRKSSVDYIRAFANQLQIGGVCEELAMRLKVFI